MMKTSRRIVVAYAALLSVGVTDLALARYCQVDGHSARLVPKWPTVGVTGEAVVY